jgi:hypothetical protein
MKQNRLALKGGTLERGMLEHGTLERGMLVFTFICYLSIF